MRCNSNPSVTPGGNACGKVTSTCIIPDGIVSISELINIYYPPFAQKNDHVLVSLGDCVFGSYNPKYDRKVVPCPKKAEHQRRVNNMKLYNLLEMLETKLKNITILTFEDLFNAVASCNVFSSGSLVVYDVAHRIAFWKSTPQYNILPISKVYLQRGAMDGAKALFKGKNIKLTRVVDKDIFTTHFPEFGNMTAYDIENFLCVFKNNI